MAANRWSVGTMYYEGLLNGAPFFTQPGGPGTQVFPTQKNSVPWTDWPVVGLVMNEYLPWWSPGCGHSIKEWKVIREFDYTTNMSVALICCQVCSYVQGTMEPFDSWYLPNAANSNAIIIA